MAEPPLLTLSGGVRIPQLSAGVSGAPAPETARVVRIALEVGYRGVDTAAGNEAEVGAAIAASEVAREDLFVTTRPPGHGYDETLRAFDLSLAAFGLDRLDLYLVPGPAAGALDTWRALVRLHGEGRVRAIGVSDFPESALRRLIDETGVAPALNQVELHPWRQQVPLREFQATHGILTGATSPLARGVPLGDETVKALAAKYGKTPAQIVLRWHLQLGVAAVPKSAIVSRIRDNFEITDFELADDDVMVLSELDNTR